MCYDGVKVQRVVACRSLGILGALPFEIKP